MKNYLNPESIKRFTDPRNIGLYLFVIVVLAISWSSVSTIQTNYELQKKIAELKQQNDNLNLVNQNIALQSKYLGTDQYLELAARQDLGLAAPGEQILLVPQDVALKYVDPKLSIESKSAAASVSSKRPWYVKNIQSWCDFLLGRNVSQ